MPFWTMRRRSEFCDILTSSAFLCFEERPGCLDCVEHAEVEAETVKHILTDQRSQSPWSTTTSAACDWQVPNGFASVRDVKALCLQTYDLSMSPGHVLLQLNRAVMLQLLYALFAQPKSGDSLVHYTKLVKFAACKSCQHMP